MNRLFVLNDMGFKISWKLVEIDLFGYGEIPPQITHLDTVEYIESLLTEKNKQIDDAITIYCEKDDFTEFDRVLKELARNDNSDIVIQKFKWRAYLLDTLITNICNKDCMQGQLELMEFWTQMGTPSNCPQPFPHSRQSLQDYFTKDFFESCIRANQKWLTDEISRIIDTESIDSSH